MLSGKLAFVTGAGSGIGRATSLLFAREGAQIIAIDQNKNALGETINQIKEGTGHSSFILDVSNSENVEEVFSKIKNKYPIVPNVIVNAAGITKDSFLLKMKYEMFQKVIDVNLMGTYNIIKSACTALTERKTCGSIINLASIVGQTGNMGQANYSASKAGVEALTKTVAIEMGEFGIRCNAVVPGIIDTPIIATVPDKVISLFQAKIPMKRLGKPEEVAEVITFLASDRSSYISGASISVTGGL